MDKKRFPMTVTPKIKDRGRQNIIERGGTRLNIGVLSCKKYGVPPDVISSEMVCEFFCQHILSDLFDSPCFNPNNYKLQNFSAPFFLVYSVYFRLVGLQKRHRIR